MQILLLYSNFGDRKPYYSNTNLKFPCEIIIIIEKKQYK